MTKTLAAAFKKASELPESAQDVIGQAVIERVNAIERLRAMIQVGMDDVKAGRVGPLDRAAIMRRIRAHARKRK